MPWSTDRQWFTDPSTLQRYSRAQYDAERAKAQAGGLTINQLPLWVSSAAAESAGNNASGDPFSVPGGAEQLGQGIEDLGQGVGTTLGLIPKQVDPLAPGASLDTTNADAERQHMDSLMAQLEQTAASGGGAWEQVLANATQGARGAAQAAGQSQRGVTYGSGLRNIRNAKAGVDARAESQGTILRDSAKRGAQEQYTQLLGSQGDQDINQADAAAKAQQAQRELNAALVSNANTTFKNTAQSAGQMIAMASKGGEVPGEPVVFGNDERNDIVPALLSPNEIVIPVSHAGSPEDAADFVRALRARPQKMNAGGTAGKYGDVRDIYRPPSGLPGDNGSGLTSTGAVMQDFGSQGQAPSIQNGGLLDTRAFDKNRTAHTANMERLATNAAGMGGTAQGQLAQDSLDAALQSVTGGPNVAGRVGAAAQGAAGEAGAGRLAESARDTAAFGNSAAAQRGRELAMAHAAQQAAWRNTQMNAGVGLEQQAQLRGVLGGAGQALAGFSDMEPAISGDFGGSDLNVGALSSNDYAGRGSASDLGGDEAGAGDPLDWDDPWAEPFAKGGVVHAKSNAPERPKSDAPRRRATTVDVLEPTQLDRVSDDPLGFIGPETPRRPRYDPDEGWLDELEVQRAHGGSIPDPRAVEFIRALKKRAA